MPEGPRLWALRRTDEYHSTWERVSRQLSRPSAHMAAMERAIARRPHDFSFVTTDARVRLIRTVDPHDRLEVRLYFRINEGARQCELGWVQVVPLADQGDRDG